jgi:hypothetical protein
MLELVANCSDVENEETMLQTKGQGGELVDRTPKCHCGLAGKGIEYSWGALKTCIGGSP